MGRAAIPLRPFHDKPGEAVDAWYDLGKGEWSNDDGTVRAAGRRPRCSAHGQRSGSGFVTGWLQTVPCMLRWTQSVAVQAHPGAAEQSPRAAASVQHTFCGVSASGSTAFGRRPTGPCRAAAGQGRGPAAPGVHILAVRPALQQTARGHHGARGAPAPPARCRASLWALAQPSGAGASVGSRPACPLTPAGSCRVQNACHLQPACAAEPPSRGAPPARLPLKPAWPRPERAWCGAVSGLLR